MTLFDDMVKTVLNESIIGRAVKKEVIEINVHNIRSYSKNKHKTVDDTPYGGGNGMVMSPVPIYDCYLDIIKPETNSCAKKHVIYMSPQGKVLTQEKAKELSENYDNLIILCGHYEGIDERIIEEIVDEEISIGDYVLTGGELPACILVDCVSRMIDGVLSSKACYEDESLNDNLLEYPQYTKPYEFLGKTVPDILISGHHENIDKWRNEQSIQRTKKKRPDLYKKYKKSRNSTLD